MPETTGRAISVVNPATEEELARYDEFTAHEVEQAIVDAHEAQQAWQETSFGQRSELLRKTAAALRSGSSEYAALITREMGKPIRESEAEIEKCAWNCEFYAEEGQAFLANRQVSSSAQTSYVTYEPIGVVLAIMPWNFPFWQVFRFAAPVLMAGNGALLKHSPNVSGCALAIEELLRKVGFPSGLFRTLLISDASVTEATDSLLHDPRVAAVTLTGSERAGAAVGAAAGRALKKSVLELGGSDPFIVLDDADVATVAQLGARSRFINGGQSCIAAKRFIVAEQVADEFEQRFVEAVAAMPVGDPLDDTTSIGPMARADLLDGLTRQVEESVERGARALLGGKRLPRRGYFFEPTVLADVDRDMPAFRQETFGPVAALIRARDEEAAIELANDTPYGLSASVWTRDIERGIRLGRRVTSGALFVNGVVASDPRLPFGGTKRSGYGRELSAEGIREFANIRTVWIGPATVQADSAPLSE
jgi:succinate-semialdehyde dehydrogenase / glutarate-semialdehyde dehydrogenase